MSEEEYFEELDKIFENTSYERVKKILKAYDEKQVERKVRCKNCDAYLHYHDCERTIRQEDEEITYTDEIEFNTYLVCYLTCPKCKKEFFSHVVKRLYSEHLR